MSEMILNYFWLRYLNEILAFEILHIGKEK